MQEERFPHPEKPFPWLEGQPAPKRSFIGSEESAAAGLLQAEQRESCSEGPDHPAVVLSLRYVPAGAHRGKVLQLSLQGTEPGRGLALAAQRQL